MNKVFKVVYSKSKGCYVVVPETAKNNNGKKKVLASVLAGLALVGAAGVTPVHATLSADGSIDTNNSRINIKTANTVGDYGDQTVGVNSVAVGYGNSTNNEDGTIVYGAANKATANAAIALGNRNEASGGNAVALGTSNTATNVKTIAIGNKSNANADGAIAIGAYNNQNYIENSSNTTPKQAGGNSVVVGNYSHAGGRQSVAIGNNATSQHDDSVAIGADVSALAGHNIAIGSGGTKAQSAPGKTGSAAIAIGLNAQATYGTDTGAFDMIAIGNQTTASANAATAIGTLSKATANNSTAIGNKAQATASGTLAIGQVTNASAHGAVALGNGAQSNGVGSTSLGRTAKATNDGSVAVGFNAEATGDHAIAIGGDGKGEAFTDSPNTFAGLNQKTTASATNSISVGHNAKASIVDGVALGSSSVTTTDKGVLGYNPSDPHERKYAPLTGNVQTATTAAVSIGNGQQMTRQLTGLAAGTADTDAVNVAQLKNVGVAVTGNTGKSDFLTDGGKLNVIGTGRVSTVAAHDGAKDSRITVGFDDKGMVKAGKNVKVDEVTVNGKTTYTINAADTAAKYDFLTNAKANGGKLDGTANPATVASGNTVNYAAGKNLTVKQEINQSIGEQTYTYSLNSDLGGITSITNNGGTTMHFDGDNISITGGNLDLGDNNITNLKSGGDTINNAANIGDVTRISKANDKHIKPGEYAVDNNGKVTMTYVDGNNKDVANETAVITGIAKQDLSNINKGGETVIQNLAKKSIDMENGKNTKVSNREINGVKTFKVDVEGDLTDITSITNKDGDGKVVFGGNQTVNVAGDHNINLNAKVGDITGLTNVTLDAPDFAKKGRAATEEQLNIVNNKFNNTVGLTGNTGATELQKLNKQGGLSFGVVGANNGEYIKTTASGSNVVADLSDSAKNKLNSTVVVEGKNAARVTSNVIQNADGSTKTVYTVDVNNVKPTAASTEKVQAKADVAGSSDKNIAKVAPKAGENFGDAGATYEVNVSRNDVKDAAREAVTVNTTNTTNNPITVTPVQDETNHNTTYQVTFDGDKAAKQIPLTYKANGQNAQTVTLDKGLNFTNGSNTTASVAADGVVKYDLNNNVNLTPSGSLTIGDTVVNNGGLTISGGPSVLKTGINAGNLNITNVKAGVNDTDAVNVKQLKSAKTEVKAGDNVTVDKTIGADGQNIYTVNAKATNLGDAELNYTANGGAKQKVKLSEGLNFVDGNYTKASVDANGVVKYDVTLGKVKDGVDGKPGVDGENGIATVKTVVDTINNSGWKGDVTGNTVGDHSATIVKPGTTVNFGAGKNLTVEQIVDKVTGNHTYNYALSDDIKVGNDGKDGKPGVDGKIGVNGKDGSAVVINGKDGSIGLNGKDGKDGLTFKGANGQDGVDGKNGTNGMTRIVYEDSNNNKHEVATTDDGLKFTGNNESVVNKNKLNSTVKVKGEGVTEEQEKTFESAAGNIAVTADGNDTLNIRLNKNIKGIDSIQTKEIHLGTPDNYTTIKKDGDRIKYGDKTFANTDDIWTIQANGTDVPANGGKVNVKGADGITVSKSANGEMTISGSGLGTMNSFNVKSSGNTTADSETAAKKITDGKTVEFSGGKNLTVKQTSDENGAKVEYALSNNVDLTNKGSVTIGDTKITDGGLVINNGPSVTKDGINAGNKQITNVEDGVNDTDAVNVRQLKAAKTNLVDGQNTKVTGDGSKANPYKVNVEGDLNKITSITNNEGDGKLEFKGDQVVNVAGDNTIKLDGKTGDITGLTNKTLDSADFATKGRAATEEQLKLVQQEAAKKSTEKVQAKADANNIAKVAPKAGDTFGAAGATYEVSVDKNDVKDAAREAVTVSGDNKAITVDVQPNATNHTTNYQVNFNGKEAAKQIPLTYKENGGNARTVMLSDGLDFSNGVNTTAHTDANGKVSFDVKGDLTNITSISNNSNGPKVSFGGDTVNITGGNLNMGGNKITNVQKGTNDTDAVNVKQLKDSRTTLTSDDHSVALKKTESADGGLNYDLSVKGAVDPRVDQLNEEIGRVGAQGAALAALKPIQYDPLEPTQIMAGYGNYRGNSAIAMGVAHYKNESTMFHGGLSWAGGSSHMMANAGVTWKVGNRDAEAAVADRYRKGPISSAYAVQTEMAAMKAQNAGLKGEVSDLKYENEQIKAQNAGLQSEVEVLKAQMAAMMAKMGM